MSVAFTEHCQMGKINARANIQCHQHVGVGERRYHFDLVARLLNRGQPGFFYLFQALNTI